MRQIKAAVENQKIGRVGFQQQRNVMRIGNLLRFVTEGVEKFRQTPQMLPILGDNQNFQRLGTHKNRILRIMTLLAPASTLGLV